VEEEEVLWIDYKDRVAWIEKGHFLQNNFQVTHFDMDILKNYRNKIFRKVNINNLFIYLDALYR